MLWFCGRRIVADIDCVGSKKKSSYCDGKTLFGNGKKCYSYSLLFPHHITVSGVASGLITTTMAANALNISSSDG